MRIKALLGLLALAGCESKQPAPPEPPTPPTAAEVPPTVAPAIMPAPVAIKPRSLSDLTSKEKNQLWWELERGGNAIADALGERYTDSVTDLKAFTMSIDREVREPIANRYGISYTDARKLYDEGETARWRTESAP